jgi:hypothetical protein
MQLSYAFSLLEPRMHKARDMPNEDFREAIDGKGKGEVASVFCFVNSGASTS